MTNAVDMLLVGGESHGRMICCRKPLSATYDVLSKDSDVETYKRREHTYYGTGKRYHIGTVDDDVTDDFIDQTITATDFQPAWDLPAQQE